MRLTATPIATRRVQENEKAFDGYAVAAAAVALS